MTVLLTKKSLLTQNYLQTHQLIALGADFHSTKSSMGPLLRAAISKHQDIVSQLINLGAEGEIAWRNTKKYPENILSTYYSQKETSKEKNWLCFMIRLKNNEEVLKHIFFYLPKDVLEPLINQFDTYGQTPLYIAMVARNEEAISLLLSHGASPLLGKFNSLRLASRIPEWQRRSEDSLHTSLYQQIYTASQKHYFVLLRDVFKEIPEDVINYLIGFVLALHEKAFD